ncbi:MAG: RIO1 family regulatory kinase/ATPase [Candidatus Bathyarchaeia archaeon]
MEKEESVPLGRLAEEPYVSIICYPKPTKAEVKKRLQELEKLQISGIKFCGKKQILNLNVLGKGCVGIVVVALRKNEHVALKIRRVDADRNAMKQEAKLLEKANSQQVGPKLLAYSRNFLVMQLVEGFLFPEWLRKVRGKTRLRKVLRELLEQCWRLDQACLDHGELSHAPKHVIIDENDNSFIVDFETSSLKRKPSNVTSLCQFLFIGSETARLVNKKLGGVDKREIINALREYKKEKSRMTFRKVLETCGLYTM